MISVAIVEDTDKIREKMVKLIESTKGFKLVKAYLNAVMALPEIYKLKIDVVIMDISMPGISGIDAVKVLYDKMPNSYFIMMSVHDDDENIFNALRAGASGYILKNSTDEKIIDSINDVVKGGSPMSTDIARRVVKSFNKPKKIPVGYDQLSSREKDILELLKKGYQYKEIASMLYISKETVKKHIHHIYTKLQVQNRLEIINKFDL